MINKFSELPDVKSGALDTLRNEAEADVFKALTSFKLLLDHPAGIGDHSTEDYHKNLRESLDLLCDANDRLEVLRKYFYT
jgi:hypothetical protein